MKIGLVLGTRPEIIKLSPIIRKLKERGIPFFIIHTGQHYSPLMDKVFFDDLNLPSPKYNLKINKKEGYNLQLSTMVKGIKEILKIESPDFVLVQGDTNSVLAGAIACKIEGIKLVHIEAGLRSGDMRMPEETNRIITDNLSDILFPPTKKAEELLELEGFDQSKIFNVGNTIVDSVLGSLKLVGDSDILKKFKLKKGEYILLTLHRGENVDNKEVLEEILTGVKEVQKELNVPLIFPIHPRTKNRIEEFGIKLPKEITLIKPQGFLEFLRLESEAKIILTDSGGVQEEACILKVPCVTLRISTERPETVELGANIIAGVNSLKIVSSTKEMINRKKDWDNPFGDGTSSDKIIDILLREGKK